jgi:hypothetical protein
MPAAVFALSPLRMLFQMLETGCPDPSFRVLLREGSRRREAALDEFRERIAGFLAIALVLAVPLSGLVSSPDFALVDDSVAAEPHSGLRGFTPPAVNPAAVLTRLESNELSPSDIRAVQTRLKESGFDPGPIDGVAGKRTLAALNAYRESIRLTPVLVVSRETIGALQLR